MSLDEPALDFFQVLLEQLLAGSNALIRIEENAWCRRAPEPGWPRPGEQPRQKIGAIVGHLDDGLVEEVLDQVLAPDVDDERHARTQRRDVGEVLIRSDTKVGAVG